MLSAAGLAMLAAMPNTALAQEEEAEARQETVIVTGSLRALPVEDVGSVFGFDKTLTEIPRSASTISSDQIERFGITDIYGLVAQSPGTFTNSFFGVGGALDIRGQAGETYFRGVRRLDNPGNYATPIAAADRIDIVRGPASPIYGPSKSGGYMNFVPKSARIEGGKYMAAPEGEITYTGGSWDKSVLSGTITGPGNLFGQAFGYNLYAEIEDSGSYYNNISTQQTILQAAFDTNITEKLRAEFGVMYHDFEGAQNGGWNRLSQDLVDNGTYVTGTAQPLDTDGDGQLSQAEFDAVGVFNPFGAFACGGGATADGWTDACLTAAYPYLALENVGTAKLSRQNVLTGPEDSLQNEDIAMYFDLIWEGDDGFEIKNQMFYESYDNRNLNSYGFAQFHDSWVFEDKIVIANEFEFDGLTVNTQLSPSIRYTEYRHGDDFDYEFFHRVDLTQGYDARSDRLLALECDCGWADYNVGNYTDYGIAGLVDAEFDFGLGVLLGIRHDTIAAEAVSGRYSQGGSGDESDSGVSWNASVNYKTPFGVIPYVTFSEQTVVIAGQGADISGPDVAAKTFLTATEMREVGVKGDFLDGRLYAAVSYYEQERTDRNVQSTTVNQDIKTEGLEAEMRWSVSDSFLITAAYTNSKIVNETFLTDGTAFSFFGIDDMPNVTDPSLIYGGQPIGLVLIPDEDAAKRQGIPENMYSITGTYDFGNGFSVSGSAVNVEEVFSGQSRAVKLPGYTLVDLSASYEIDDWLFRVSVKNATDEEYFRANFTELFGSTIVLPEKPRSVQASVIYKF
ncbi:TonB-dependent receptor plug domain-containing protein [Henriciella sp. AS95]|uniref:TonB-dependent siderophore receptor n=1 Tax=Henriciella sp. AS95 TaxID=3135782 RepID=UPI0031724BBA